jgi:hypothetical protein
MQLFIGGFILFFVFLIMNMIISDMAYNKLLQEEKSKLIELRSKSSIRHFLFFIIIALFFAVSYFIYSPTGMIIFLLAITVFLVGEEAVFVKKLKKANMPPFYINTRMIANIMLLSSVVFFIGILSYTAIH